MTWDDQKWPRVLACCGTLTYSPGARLPLSRTLPIGGHLTVFRDTMHADQLAWRARRLEHVRGRGRWQGREYDHILPADAANLNLWSGLRPGGVRSLDAWLVENRVQAHKGRDNLLSSWTLCANLYFAFGASSEGRALVASFLRARVGLPVREVSAVELEYALRAPLDPGTLLGEHDGKRGANQTSPDVAFEATLDDGRSALVLTEVKFVEHSFYDCSGFKALDPADRVATCGALDRVLESPGTRCGHASTRGRRYWDHLAGPMEASDSTVRTVQCPAARGGYQLFRQQALAEGLARQSAFGEVVSSVAYDARNVALMGSIPGVRDVASGWGAMFQGRARFSTFTHQDWFQWVAGAASTPAWVPDWLAWVGDRYGYATKSPAAA
jgi:hypothetical protein